MCDFKPGDEVTPVHLEPLGTPYDTSLERLVVGAVYTVVDVRRPWIYASVCLKEVISDSPCGYWDASRFRKVQRRRSDAAVERLKSLCDDPGQLIEKTHAERVAGMQEEFREAMRSMFGEWGDVE